MTATRQRIAAGACALLTLAVAACVSTAKNPQPPPPAAVPGPPPLEASYDWHGLLLVPFGSVLKEIPFTLHEVLLFRDASHAAPADDAECYAMEQAAPRFVARTPAEYMLCFKHDRLSRVQATVNLPRSEAAQIFGDACGLWHRNVGAAVGGAGQPAASQPASAPAVANEAATPGTGQAGACDGRDGAIGYTGRLDQEADQAEAPLTITLDAAVQP
jgi:hypothetical protein